MQKALVIISVSTVLIHLVLPTSRLWLHYVNAVCVYEKKFFNTEVKVQCCGQFSLLGTCSHLVSVKTLPTTVGSLNCLCNAALFGLQLIRPDLLCWWLRLGCTLSSILNSEFKSGFCVSVQAGSFPPSEKNRTRTLDNKHGQFSSPAHLLCFRTMLGFIWEYLFTFLINSKYFEWSWIPWILFSYNLYIYCILVRVLLLS